MNCIVIVRRALSDSFFRQLDLHTDKFVVKISVEAARQKAERIRPLEAQPVHAIEFPALLTVYHDTQLPLPQPGIGQMLAIRAENQRALGDSIPIARLGPAISKDNPLGLLLTGAGQRRPSGLNTTPPVAHSSQLDHPRPPLARCFA